MRFATHLCTALTALLLAGPLAAAPSVIHHQGRLLDSSGAPLQGDVDLQFALYQSATDPTPVWVEAHGGVPLQEGLFHVLLGGISTLDPQTFSTALWLGVRVNGEAELSPRLALGSVPHAFRAQRVEELDADNVAQLLALLNSLPDADGDGYSGARFGGEDCDDRDAHVHPGATEICDGLDNDCNGTPDDGFDAYWWYPDADGDGFGVGPAGRLTCAPPPSWVMADGDCDDSSAALHPGAVELCDGLDNDCNGQVDDNATTGEIYYYDGDQDGYGEGPGQWFCSPPYSHWAQVSMDCNNQDASIYPGAQEICDNQDNNCDGQVDEGISQMWYPDNDGDGWGSESGGVWTCEMPWGPYTAMSGDCDDSNNNVWPGSAEICSDGVDNNCDGQVDEYCP